AGPGWRPAAVLEQVVAADPGVNHGPAARGGKAFCKPVRPAPVFLGGRADAVGDGVAERDDHRLVLSGFDLNARDENTMVGPALRSEGLLRIVARWRDLGRGEAEGMAGAAPSFGGQIEADLQL